MKSKRIIIWVTCLVVAIIVIAFNNYKENLPKVEQGPNLNNVYNDVEKENLVKSALDNAGASSKKKINFLSGTDSANCILTKDIDKLKDDENKVTLISYTPLIIVMKNSADLQKYKDGGLLISSKEINNSNEDEISIDFKKVVDAVVNGEDWSTFGGEEKAIKIIVPEKDSIEGGIFYSFLLATINGGSYPQSDAAISSAKEIADNFYYSSSCVEAENVVDDLGKISSVNRTDMYVVFEADLMNSTVWSQNKLDMSITYPTTTVVKHIYMQTEEDCTELFNSVSTQLNYRTSNTHSFAENRNYNVKDNIEFIEVPVEDFSLTAGEVVACILLTICIVVLLLYILVAIFV